MLDRVPNSLPAGSFLILSAIMFYSPANCVKQNFNSAHNSLVQLSWAWNNFLFKTSLQFYCCAVYVNCVLQTASPTLCVKPPMMLVTHVPPPTNEHILTKLDIVQMRSKTKAEITFHLDSGKFKKLSFRRSRQLQQNTNVQREPVTQEPVGQLWWIPPARDTPHHPSHMNTNLRYLLKHKDCFYTKL